MIAILAAFTGLGISAYVTYLLNMHQGSSATIIYLLIGIPSYSLIMLGYRIARHWSPAKKGYQLPTPVRRD